MLLDEMKATLAMENLVLSEEQEELLRLYAEGKIDFLELKHQLMKMNKDNKVA